MEPRYNNHLRISDAGYQRRRLLRPPLLRLCSSSCSPSSPLNNRRSVFAVRTERQRLRPTTTAPSPPSSVHDWSSAFAYSPSLSSPGDRPLPLVASTPETTSATPDTRFGPRKSRPNCCRSPCSSFNGNEKETMRAESRVSGPQRRWRHLAAPPAMSSDPPRNSFLSIPRCTADDTMTSCTQPASSKPSASSALPSCETRPTPSRERTREAATSNHRSAFLSLKPSLLFTIFVLLLLSVSGSIARPQDDDDSSAAASNHEYRVDAPTDLSLNRTAFFQLAGRKSFDLLKGERVIEPPLDSRKGRKEKWLQRHKNRKDKNERRGRKRLKGEQKQSFILTRNELPKFENTCVGVKITQRVRMAGCLSRVVHNRYCHGSCTSVFIPRLRAKKLKATFESCSACLPSDYDRVEIRLECPNRVPPVIVRRVIKVKSCSCQSQCQIKNV